MSGSVAGDTEEEENDENATAEVQQAKARQRVANMLNCILSLSLSFSMLAGWLLRIAIICCTRMHYEHINTESESLPDCRNLVIGKSRALWHFTLVLSSHEKRSLVAHFHVFAFQHVKYANDTQTKDKSQLLRFTATRLVNQPAAK